MASSNRHWPSMFKSKPCDSHHQWQHDPNPSSLLSTGCHRTPYSSDSAPGCEERTPEPKPRWNPKPEQIRILEAIFNSGMVNPPRDEIRKIRAQLQEYGQVGDANVFYWFQNRKSRSKHKLRNLQNSSKQQQQQQQQEQQQNPLVQTLAQYQSPQLLVTSSIISTLAAPTSSSSSSSSEKSSSKLVSKRSSYTSTLSLTSPSHVLDVSNSPSGSVNQNLYFQPQNEFLGEPFLFPIQQTTIDQGFCFSDASNMVQVQDSATVRPCTSLLLSEILSSGASKKDIDHLGEKNLTTRMEPQLSYTITPPITHTVGIASPLSITTPTPDTNISVTVPATIHQIPGNELGPMGSGTITAIRSTVFINDVPFDVAMGPFNVREAFGDDVLLIHSSGQPVFTNEWGVTIHSLQHGGFYYLVPLPTSAHI